MILYVKQVIFLNMNLLFVLLFNVNILLVLSDPNPNFHTIVIEGDYNVEYNITLNKLIEYVYVFHKPNVSNLTK